MSPNANVHTLILKLPVGQDNLDEKPETLKLEGMTKLPFYDFVIRPSHFIRAWVFRTSSFFLGISDFVILLGSQGIGRMMGGRIMKTGVEQGVACSGDRPWKGDWGAEKTDLF